MKYSVSARTNSQSRRFHGKTRHEVLSSNGFSAEETAALLHTSSNATVVVLLQSEGYTPCGYQTQAVETGDRI